MTTLVKNFEGKPRRFGLEIEYAGVPLARSAQIVADATGGKIQSDHKTHYTIACENLGDFIVELDVELAQKISAKAKSQKDLDPKSISIESIADQILPEILETVAPTEIVSPPLSEDNLHLMQDIVEALHKEGAAGTEESLFYAFGYHINAEMRSVKAKDILDSLRAFVVLYDWVAVQLDMDVTRKISGYAAPYSEDYNLFILDPSYVPDLAQLIDDYILYNPSRNYALDLLPLFSYLDEDRVKKHINNSLIKKRPAWHFRMPNSSVGQDNWSIYDAINTWQQIEKLSDNEKTLKEMAAHYKMRKPELISGIDHEWVAYLDTHIKQYKNA